MDRLSEGAIEIVNKVHTNRLDYYSEYLPIMDALDSLAAYEDTGLNPEEIYGLCEMDKRSRMAKMLRWEQAEAEGRMLILPCKVGDTVFCIRKNPYAKGRYVKENKVLSITWDGRDFVLFTTKEDVLGKTVYLNYEFAKEALNGQKKL